jgi:hypothetical protein
VGGDGRTAVPLMEPLESSTPSTVALVAPISAGREAVSAVGRSETWHWPQQLACEARTLVLACSQHEWPSPLEVVAGPAHGHKVIDATATARACTNAVAGRRKLIATPQTTTLPGRCQLTML